MITISKKTLLAGIAVLCVVLFAGLYWHYRQQNNVPEIENVPSVSKKNLKDIFRNETDFTLKDLNYQMNRAKETQAPQYHFYTTTQTQSDKQAQQYAKEQKADKIIKESREQEILDEQGKPSGEKIIENSYYGISLERKHKIKAGAAMIDQDAYATLTYQNRDVDYTIYYSPDKQKAGAGVSVTLAKW